MMGNVWKYARNLVHSHINVFRPRKTKQRRFTRPATLQFEGLEQRRLLAADQIQYDSATSSILIYGSAVDDRATVAVGTTGDFHVLLQTQDASYSVFFPVSTVSSVKFFGGRGDDVFNNFSPLPSEAWGDEGNDTLTGGSASDRFTGGPGADRLIGGVGDDELRGEEGNDELIGLEGIDLLVGGDGDDQLFGGDGNDLLKGGDGQDKLFGQYGDDGLWGGTGNDELAGGLGDDYLVGGEGDDTIGGDDGDDRAYGGDGNDWISGWLGNDELDGGTGHDQIFGGEGHDRLIGDEGNDEIRGGDGDDWLSGGSGDDLLEAGFGNDHVAGDEGVDYLGGDEGDDTLNGGDGDDWISGWMGNDELHGGSGNDFLAGGEGDDYLFGGDGDDELVGDAGNDWLVGGNGNDELKAGLGNDDVIGGGGDDRLSGDDGDDELYGGEGSDWISGWNGDDLLDGGTDDDYLDGAAGNDSIRGGDGNDELHGGSGSDWLWGMNGDDVVYGELGDDFLVGGAGNDSLIGDAGNDLLDGGAGDDKLLAGDDNDALIGGAGHDELSGWHGDDLLIGGTTAYEGQVQKYRALMDAWSSESPYAARIEAIESELFAARLQSEHSVFHEAAVDGLLGGRGQDWFFLTGQMPTYRPDEVVVEDHSSHHDGGDHHHSDSPTTHDIPVLEGFDLIDTLDKLSDRQTGEAIHSLIPHADKPTLLREHLSLFELVRYDQVTHIAVRSGGWSDPATWQHGIVPGSDAHVLIPAGVEIRVDGMLATRVATIRVDGVLSFDSTRNTELRVDTVVVSGSGTFQMGTAEQPIGRNVQAILTFTNNGAIDRQWDPFGISRGLIAHGKISIYGAETNSHAAIAGALTAGTQRLTLKSVPVGWEAGDTVVVASTSGAEENELRTIAAIEGNVLVLDQPLEYSHAAPAANLDVHIANTTRNAILRSESFASDRRGHVMFMHNRDVRIAYAGFYRLGRTDKSQVINDSVVGTDWTLQEGTGTNQRARYPVHFHRNGIIKDGHPATIRGSAVVDSPGWGFVNHSSYVDMIDNVAFAVRGASFATEVGDEIGGFYGNIALGTTGSSEEANARELLQDFGHQGDGFWFQGAGVSVVGNISAGNQRHAFAYYTRGLIESSVVGVFRTENLADPSIADGQTSIPVGEVPVTDFRDNIGYSSYMGLLIRYHLRDVTHGKTSLFENSKFWNNTVGVGLHYAQHLVLRNLQIVQVPNHRHTRGIEAHLIETDITYDNLTVIGYHTGIQVPRWGNNLVRGGIYQNIYHDILIPTAAWRDRNVLLTGFTATPKITLADDVEPIPNNSAELFFIQDRVILDFGPFASQQAFYWRQQADIVPFPEARPDVPAEYVGQTNQQLWDRFGKALSGQIAPSDAYGDPKIIGALIERP